VLGALMSLTAVLAACGGSTKNNNVKSPAPVASVAANATTTDGEVILAVSANDFSFTLNRPTVPAGRVHVQLINRSKDYQHEVWVYPQTQPKLEQLLGLKRSGQVADELDYLQGLAGHVEDVPAGQMAAFDADLTPGTYELSCFITSDIGGKMMMMVHYDMGMHALVTVQ
jgi:uncharacterized cupredoxin-like copper-binding protein